MSKKLAKWPDDRRSKVINLDERRVRREQNFELLDTFCMLRSMISEEMSRIDREWRDIEEVIDEEKADAWLEGVRPYGPRYQRAIKLRKALRDRKAALSDHFKEMLRCEEIIQIHLGVGDTRDYRK